MADSILITTKRTLGLAEDYVVFDPEIIMHINSVLGTLNQLGVGPKEGFMIEDKEATWSDFIGDDPRLNPTKSYVYLRTRLLFDPPSARFVITSWEKQIAELEWRLYVQQEDTNRPLQPPAPVLDPWDVMFDGYLI